MAQGWTFSDHVLWQVLGAWLDSLPDGEMWYVDLYVNDYSPQPGDTFAEYDPPSDTQWPGYAQQPIAVSEWSEVQVVNHVAQTVQPEPVQFALGNAPAPVIVYGYFITDQFANLIDAEAFSSPQTVPIDGGIFVVPKINLAIQTYFALMKRGRGRPKKLVRYEDEEEEEEEE